MSSLATGVPVLAMQKPRTSSGSKKLAKMLCALLMWSVVLLYSLPTVYPLILPVGRWSASLKMKPKLKCQAYGLNGNGPPSCQRRNALRLVQIHGESKSVNVWCAVSMVLLLLSLKIKVFATSLRLWSLVALPKMLEAVPRSEPRDDSPWPLLLVFRPSETAMLVREILLGAVSRLFTRKDYEIGFRAARLQYGGTQKAVLEELSSLFCFLFCFAVLFLFRSCSFV